MTYDEIAAFLAVVKYGTMSQAAQKLSLSQSTVSSQIKSLEDEFGVRLFKRGKGMKNATLTQAGNDILEIAYKWEMLWNETKHTLERSNRSILQIASVPSVSRYLLFNAVSVYAEAHPDSHFELWNLPSEKCYGQVEIGDVNAAFVTRPRYSAVVSSTPVLSETYLLISPASSDHGKFVHPSDLDPRQELFTEWDEAFLEWHRTWWGTVRESKIDTNSMSFLRHMLERDSDYWCVAPVSVATELARTGEFKLSKLREGPEDHFVYILARSPAEMPQEIKEFLRVLKSTTVQYNVKWHYKE